MQYNRLSRLYRTAVLNWICPRCSEELGVLNGFCEYCYTSDNTIVYNPDKYAIRAEYLLYHVERSVRDNMDNNMNEKELFEHIDSNQNMTPQEKLHAKLFYHEKVLVKDMDTLTLRAHIEELSKIAFEARARYHAAKDEDDTRTKQKNKDGKPTGFERSVNADESTTDAINVIKERQKKLTKSEKVQAGLQAMYELSGMSRAEAEAEASKTMSAGAILARLKDKNSKDIVTDQASLRAPLSQQDGFVIKNPSTNSTERSEVKPIFNPFAKKEE